MKIKHIGMTAHAGGLTKLTIVVDGDRGAISEQVMAANEDPDEKPWELILQKVKKRRSLDANAYCWVLIGKLAEKLRMSPREVYREAIKDVPEASTVVCVTNEAVGKLMQSWVDKGIGWQAELFPSRLPGCTNVMLWYGSSVYDSAQMSALIDRIVEECKTQNIETQTPDEILRLKEAYANAYNHSLSGKD